MTTERWVKSAQLNVMGATSVQDSSSFTGLITTAETSCPQCPRARRRQVEQLLNGINVAFK